MTEGRVCAVAEVELDRLWRFGQGHGGERDACPELALGGLGLRGVHPVADHVLDQAVFESYRKLLLAQNLSLLEWYDDGWARCGMRA